MTIKSILKKPNSRPKNKSVHFKSSKRSSVSKQKLKRLLTNEKTTLNKVWSSKNPQRKFETTIKKLANKK